MRLATVDKNATYTPGSYPSYYSSWYGYYSSTYPRFNDPGYYSTGGVYHIETNVYSLTKNKLLWTGITSAVNTTDTNALVNFQYSFVSTLIQIAEADIPIFAFVFFQLL